jgi:hypothetical protein
MDANAWGLGGIAPLVGGTGIDRAKAIPAPSGPEGAEVGEGKDVGDRMGVRATIRPIA